MQLARGRLAIPILVFLAACLLLMMRGTTGLPKGIFETQGEGLPPQTKSGASRSHGAENPAVASPERHWWVDTEHAAVTMSGRVLLDGQPHEGIEVVLVDDLTSAGAGPRRTSRTDGRGRFQFAALPCIRGRYRVYSVHEGATPSWTSRSGCISKDDLELRMDTCKSYLYGTLSDASGGPVVGARVYFAEAPEHGAWTDNLGSYRLCAGPGVATLKIDANGYGASQRSVFTDGTRRQDFSLVPETELEGNVVFARDRSPAAHAIVLVDSEGSMAREGEYQADAEGHFRIEHLSPDRYRLSARTKHGNSYPPVTAEAFASSKARVTIVVEERARVSGRVVSPAGPEKNVLVNFGVWGDGKWGTRSATDETGAFSIEDVPLGNLLVHVNDFRVEDPRLLDVTEKGVEGLTIHVARKGELRVLVTRDKAPVYNAKVHIRSSSENLEARTSTKGIATFRGLTESSYRVVAESAGSFGVAENQRVGKHPEGDETPDTLIELTRGRQIQGRVIDEHGKAVDGASVSLSIQGSTEELGATAVTDSDGRFQGGPLNGPSQYALRVSRSGVWLEPKVPFAPIVVPQEGPATPVNGTWIVKANDREVEGKVVHEGGEPFPDVRVFATSVARHSDTLSTTFSGADGTFRLGGLAEGPYTITAYAPSGVEVTSKPVTPPSEPLTISVPSPGKIAGSLKGFARTPTIIAWKETGYDWHDVRFGVVENGQYTIEGLARAKYYVGVVSPAGADTKRADLTQAPSAIMELVASGTRTVRGIARDLVGGGPLAGLSCQCAPFIEGSRSPVVVPITTFTGQDGRFEFVGVPSSDLYMWCLGDGPYRGGVAKLPAANGEKEVNLWGLSMHGARPANADSLGITFDDDFPFSRRIQALDSKGVGTKSGLQIGDEVMSADGKDLTEVGTGTARTYLAERLTEKSSIPIVVRRGGGDVSLDLHAPK